MTTPQCCCPHCDGPPYNNLPVCFGHAMIITQRLTQLLQREPDPLTTLAPPHALTFIYYLMREPTTVKIGATQNLAARIRLLHTNIQYVVALEHGPPSLQRQRHREFSDERLGRREDFHLSQRLKKHITALAPQRDQLLTLAQQLV